MPTAQAASRRWGTLAVMALAVAAVLGGAQPADAKKVHCKRSEVSVPDDREGGGNLCMSKKERDRAKAICRKNGSKNWLECTCQDGNSVGACGD